MYAREEHLDDGIHWRLEGSEKRLAGEVQEPKYLFVFDPPSIVCNWIDQFTLAPLPTTREWIVPPSHQ